MSFKNGTIVKSRYSTNHFTVLSNTEWFSHQTHKVSPAPKDTANYVQVHPKPREAKVGDIVKHKHTGLVYTVAAGDKFFDHTKKEMVDDTITATEHINTWPSAFEFLS